ncbi:hypothetical protein PTRG_00558 [Pyrenophora tritici-repentis Pt-1C-BFP]|uniref:Uncharacterized protein n=1 Tax=Pyrenophora tritici-repentis (strain Pt-1C-BFP) TaxID=426418 RepID=B2VQL4_PYRTR|nr:uncharacterized protein PTRG_00558 [Pyrenophora tritici-repentis Pt-1C-BFP]EDU39996.1 hypothetical protein PTRG_00558 [Pyrenophora tritici-repentis Pt-1C-BFP]
MHFINLITLFALNVASLPASQANEPPGPFDGLAPNPSDPSCRTFSSCNYGLAGCERSCREGGLRMIGCEANCSCRCQFG